jgi:hypothetical protein
MFRHRYFPIVVCAAIVLIATVAVIGFGVGIAEASPAKFLFASVPVSAWFENAYIKGATHRLQSRGYLTKGTTREPDRVQARTLIWRRAGAGKAQQMSDIPEEAPVMNSDRDTVQGDLTDWQAADWIRHPDINKMSENEQEVVQTTAAMALGRRFDRLHFDEFDAQAGAIATIGNGTAATNLLDLDAAEATIIGAGVLGEMELFCPLPAMAFKQLMLWKQFSSADYVGPDYPLASMTMRKKYGFVTYFAAPNSLFSYDTGTSDDADATKAWATADWFQTYMWIKYAVGFGSNYELQSKITWENRFTAYFANNWMPGLCKVILPEGVMRLKFDWLTTVSIPADTKLAP